jgi:hypothetical protein
VPYTLEQTSANLLAVGRDGGTDHGGHGWGGELAWGSEYESVGPMPRIEMGDGWKGYEGREAVIRPAVAADVPQLNAIHTYYVENTISTFALVPYGER